MANRNWSNGKSIYIPHVKPVLLDCNFVVDSTNGNGFGVRSLKGPGIHRVFMHTTQTPATGNPNPGTGVIVIQFQDNYNRSLSGFSSLVSPVSGTPLTSTTNHVAYTIVSLGTATAAQWLAAGVPAGYTPAVGLTFIAIATGTIGGAAAVEAVATAGSGITNIETIGDPNTTLAYSPAPSQTPNGLSNQGGQIILQCYASGVQTAPADGTVISLAFYMNDSSILVQGE